MKQILKNQSNLQDNTFVLTFLNEFFFQKDPLGIIWSVYVITFCYSLIDICQKLTYHSTTYNLAITELFA